MAPRRVPCPRDPIGLSREEAAVFVGISATLFDRAVSDGLMPQPRKLFGRLVWDADEILAAFRRLPHKDDSGVETSVWSDVAA